ncbi:hypothetical protein DL89DRAFT_323272 [Linderina pennispora]|uniref:Uncharacterized protein n=1 Tax=Linderina pennispora TaxID=61395 RepID=A0A1Y1W6F9_9FUNG|nr:uncharacterized protein DL89DRAFT_323272 [Linderina pennispora]ORX69130.1 hypothetical protein DL89DRAFT_323272 [Linderina pennispora]
MPNVLVSGVYPSPDTQEDKALREALRLLTPTRPDFRTADYAASFNWDEISLEYARQLNEFTHLPQRDEDSSPWYAVVFRSKRRKDCNNVDLFDADRDAYNEAFKHTGGALLVYWYTDLDADFNCLATCVWTSRDKALSVNSLPAHRQASRLSADSI